MATNFRYLFRRVIDSNPFPSQGSFTSTVIEYTFGLSKWFYIEKSDKIQGYKITEESGTDTWMLQKADLLPNYDLPPFSALCIKQVYTNAIIYENACFHCELGLIVFAETHADKLLQVNDADFASVPLDLKPPCFVGSAIQPHVVLPQKMPSHWYSSPNQRDHPQPYPQRPQPSLQRQPQPQPQINNYRGQHASVPKNRSSLPPRRQSSSDFQRPFVLPPPPPPIPPPTNHGQHSFLSPLAPVFY